MTPEQQMVRDFHKKYGCMVNDKPTLPDDRTLLLRCRLITEEAAEFVTAASNHDITEMTDALVDLEVVLLGAAVVLGIDLEPIFAEVHRSNMTKTGGHDCGGKVTKGPDFVPPKIDYELRKQGWDPCRANHETARRYAEWAGKSMPIESEDGTILGCSGPTKT